MSIFCLHREYVGLGVLLAGTTCVRMLAWVTGYGVDIAGHYASLNLVNLATLKLFSCCLISYHTDKSQMQRDSSMAPAQIHHPCTLSRTGLG
jgi:hypothetical protein